MSSRIGLWLLSLVFSGYLSWAMDEDSAANTREAQVTSVSDTGSGMPGESAGDSTGNVPIASKGKAVQLYGQTYQLVASHRGDGIETEEYALETETAESWTQRLTYQRITTPEPVSADQYVTLLKRHLDQTETPPRVRVVQQGKWASIFGVHYASTEAAAEQFGLALVTVPDPRRPNELHIIQYVAKPREMAGETLDVEVKRWQARFQSQAASMEDAGRRLKTSG